MGPKPDFSGWVTKYGIKCTDGRTILKHAFSDADGATIPLVWAHQHDSPENVLGKLVLTHKDEGVRADGFFNETPIAQHSKALVKHGDIVALSIYANQLVQRGMDVLHGAIKEGSLVLAAANPGAMIDFVNLAHADGYDVADDEAIIFSGEGLEIALDPQPDEQKTRVMPKSAQKPELALTHAADLSVATPEAKPVSGTPKTVAEVIASLDEEQRNVVYALIGQAMEQGGTTSHSSIEQSGTDNNEQEGEEVGEHTGGNVFDQTSKEGQNGSGFVLTHSDLAVIFADARKQGSLKNAVEDFAIAHGIVNIDQLFPDAQAVTDTPDWQARRQQWVQGVLAGVRKTPFSRIKTMLADITLDEARARGYVKGALKKEEWFAVSRRVTTPQTIYKRQKLDRDDILDVSGFDVVAWLKGEMRLMLDEEVARAILVGDGRDVADPDKISETNVRPIATDSDVYTTTVNIASADLPPNSGKTYEAITDAVASAMQFYQGSGMPTLYAPRSWVTKILLTKDTLGRRLHSSMTELADAMGVGRIEPVEVMEPAAGSLIGVIVNLADYSVGQDRGGEVSFFDDFDIDYNKYSYMYETRLSGALVKFKAAMVVKLFSGAGGLLPDPTPPTFVKSTGVVTVPTTANVTYVTVNDTTGAESGALTAGAQTALGVGTQAHYRAKAAATYSFGTNATSNWTFQRPAAT